MRRSALRTYTGYVPTFYYQFMFKNKNSTEVRSMRRFFYLFVSAFGTFSFILFLAFFPFFLSEAFFYHIHFHHPLPSHYLFYEIYSTDFGDFGDWQAAPVFIFYGGKEYEEVFLSFCECLWHFFIHSFFSLFPLFLKRSVFLSYSYSFSPPPPSPVSCRSYTKVCSAHQLFFVSTERRQCSA